MFSRNGMHQHVYWAHGKGAIPEDDEEIYIERGPAKKKATLQNNILWEFLWTNGVWWLLCLLLETIWGLVLQLIA